MKLRSLRVSGYKNLADCQVPMRDFNVVVGPNNSGKSNLLDLFRMLRFLWRYEPDLVLATQRHGDHLSIEIGVTFEAGIDGETWTVDYDAAVKRSGHGEIGFESEVLKAKQAARTGPAKTFLRRDGATFAVGNRRPHPISPLTSAVSAASILYPASAGNAGELPVVIQEMEALARTSVFALSPVALRNALDKDVMVREGRVSAVGLLPLLDRISQDRKKWLLFEQTVCDILDLDDIDFRVIPEDRSRPRGREGSPGTRARFCSLWGPNDRCDRLADYSDGTLIVVALVALMVERDPVGELTCIEELENCLHPAAQAELLRFLKDNSSRWQVMITTHSPYLVNGVDPDDLLVAVVGDDGLSSFRKPDDRKAVNDLLKHGYMSFGDLMVTNFREVIRAKD